MLLGVAIMACAEGRLPAPPVTWEGEHVRFGTSDDADSLCAGTLPYLDGYAGGLKELFKSEPSTVVDYFWVPDGVGSYACPEGAFGCAVGEVVYAEHVPIEHELVHAVRDPVGSSHDVLEEGLAHYLGDDWLFDDMQMPVEEAFSLAEQGQLPGSHYQAAGHFSSFLVREHGLDTVLGIAKELNAGDSTAAFSRALERRTGQALESDLAGYQDYDWCPHHHYRDARVSCDFAEPATCSEGRLVMTAAFDCDDPSVIGPRLGFLWQSFLLEIPSRAPYLFQSRINPWPLPVPICRIPTAGA